MPDGLVPGRGLAGRRRRARPPARRWVGRGPASWSYQAAEDLQEDPLGPPVERRVDGGHRPARVVGQADAAQLLGDDGDVRLGGDPRVGARLHGVLLGGQAEGVVAEGVEHVAAGHPVVAGEHVGADVAERVADVEAGARRVREHVEHVELRAVGHPVEARRTGDRWGWRRGRCPRAPIGPARPPRSARPAPRCSGGRGRRHPTTARAPDARACTSNGSGHPSTPGTGSAVTRPSHARSEARADLDPADRGRS